MVKEPGSGVIETSRIGVVGVVKESYSGVVCVSPGRGSPESVIRFASRDFVTWGKIRNIERQTLKILL